MSLPDRLLWIDWTSAAIVGVATLSLCDWLSKYGGLPRHVLLGVGLANLAYAGFALSLCIRPTRSVRLIGVLVAANLAWSLICVGVLFGHRTAVTPLALLHLGGEAVYVAGLALLEWRHRGRLAQGQIGGMHRSTALDAARPPRAKSAK